MNASTETIAGSDPISKATQRGACPLWLTLAIAAAAMLSQAPLAPADQPGATASDRTAQPAVVEPAVVEPAVVEIERLLSDGELSAAAERLAPLQENPPPGVDLTLLLARLGRGYQQSGQESEAAGAYWQAVQASERDAADTLSPAQEILVRLTAASALARTDQPAEALACLQPIGDGSLQADAEKRRFAANLLLSIGSRALAAGQLDVSRQAYSLAGPQLSSADRGTAELGVAWSLALSGRDPDAAADRLEAFLSRHGDHPDAPRAARAQVTCLTQAGRPEQAAEALAELLRRWPDGEVARQVVHDHHQLAIAQVPTPVRRWVVDQAADHESIRRLEAATVGLGLRVAAEEENIDAWNAFTKQLAARDRTGATTSDVLAHLSSTERSADAERLATQLIAPKPGAEPTPQAREAACRWAGRTERWSMLALASESESPDSADPSRTPAVERLFAEALMQTGRPSDARLWWEHLVDRRGAGDFATLLRCAETATSIATVEQAAERIEAAREAAGSAPAQRCLVDMLEAELAVRRLQFDDARALLERVVRGSESPEALRGRAQWMIGETFYMQERFADAIDAYRRVEGMDDSGHWTPAALVQAGKAFEQLGRTREAAVCYSNLVGRFADSPHARSARRRLAALRPDSSDPQPARKR